MIEIERSPRGQETLIEIKRSPRGQETLIEIKRSQREGALSSEEKETSQREE